MLITVLKQRFCVNKKKTFKHLHVTVWWDIGVLGDDVLWDVGSVIQRWHLIPVSGTKMTTCIARLPTLTGCGQWITKRLEEVTALCPRSPPLIFPALAQRLNEPQIPISSKRAHIMARFVRVKAWQTHSWSILWTVWVDRACRFVPSILFVCSCWIIPVEIQRPVWENVSKYVKQNDCSNQTYNIHQQKEYTRIQNRRNTCT